MTSLQGSFATPRAERWVDRASSDGDQAFHTGGAVTRNGAEVDVCPWWEGDDAVVGAGPVDSDEWFASANVLECDAVRELISNSQFQRDRDVCWKPAAW